MTINIILVTPVIAILALIIQQVYKLVYNVAFHPLRAFPGRLIDRACFLPHTLELFRLDTVSRALEQHRQHGHAVRLNPAMVSFSSADAWKDIYHHKPGVEREFPKDGEQYVQGSGAVTNILFAQGPDHTRIRRVMAPGFSEKALVAQETHIQSFMDLYIRGLRQRHGSESFPTADGEVNISAWNHFIASDVVSFLTFGESTNCLETGKLNPWCDYCVQALICSTWLGALPTLPMALKTWLLPKKTVYGYEEHLRLSDEAAKNRISQGVGSSKDYVSYMMQGDNHKSMSEEEMIDNINILMPAATNSTAGAVDAALWYLLHHKDWFRKLAEHVRSEFTTESEITIQRTSGMKLLQAIINEGMRLHPPVPIALPRVVPSGGRVVAGVFVPEKTIVGVNQLACYRNPDNFRDPDAYHPERWLGDDSFNDDRRDIFYPYSTGARNCIAERFAASLLRVQVARLVWNFDLELLPGNPDIERQTEAGVWFATPIRVRVTDARGNS